MHTMTNQPASKALHATITAIYQQVLVSFTQRDVARVAAIYAENGQILPAYSAAISGRGAIQAFWQGCIDMGIGTMRRTPREVDCLGDTVNEMGDYAFLDRQGRVLDVGKYVVIWKAQQGQWQIQRDIWTSNLPSR